MTDAVTRCARCALSAAFPSIEFDEHGVCSFCRDKMMATSEQSAIDRAKEQLTGLLGQRSRPYDAIMCNSGGKDSTYTLKLAVEKYGLRVLSFTMDNGFISPTARKNIEIVVDTLGVDHLTVRPSSRFYRRVIKATALLPIYQEQTLRRISAGCNACISLVNTTALKLALEKSAPLILAGFTLGQIPANAIIYRNHFRFFEESRKDSLDRLRAAVGDEVDDYYGISDAALDRVESYPFNVNLLCLEEVTEDQIVAEVEKLGWRRPADVDGCSSNCQLNTFNNFVHQRKYGYSPYELELSHLIRKGLMTRSEAIAKIEDQPVENLRFLARKLELSAQERVQLGLPDLENEP
ncbi:MAG TPA: hypothetical protein VF331_15755 [Polyangiales bacterium]